MASEGPNSPGTMADDDTVGTVSWSNVDNAKVSDDSYATADVDSLGVSHYLKATNFGFSVPVGATIDGISMEFECKMGADHDAEDNSIRIVKGGVITGTDKAVASSWGTIENSRGPYGSSSDIWGETWTDTDINASDFGVVISGIGVGGAPTGDKTISIDHITITVTYTESSGATIQGISQITGVQSITI